MGLVVSHDAFSGSFRTFNLWRNAVARAAGLGIATEVVGGQVHEVPAVDVDAGKLAGLWPSPPTDVLEVLLAHSDSEGIIPVSFLGSLAQRLAEVSPHMESSWRATTQRFIEGLRRADAEDEDLRFVSMVGTGMAPV